MELSIEVLANLPTSLVRSALADWVATHLQCDDRHRAGLSAAVQAVIDGASDDDIERLRAVFRTAGDEWRLYRSDPLARAITRTYMQWVVTAHEVVGLEHLRAFVDQPGRKLIVCNHLSYTDTQVTDVVLAGAGLGDVSDRLVAIAGPKVYTDAWRRMASIALHTRKTAQSNVVATEQEALTPRELAAVAFETIADCGRLMDEGLIVLLYPEGTRSREGRLQPFLRAAARYLAIEGVRVLPLAQTGGEDMFPIDSPVMFPAPARLVFGPSFTAKEYPGKTGALTEAHRRMAELLPAERQPADSAGRVA